jgi:hypothetical protein
LESSLPSAALVSVEMKGDFRNVGWLVVKGKMKKGENRIKRFLSFFEEQIQN